MMKNYKKKLTCILAMLFLNGNIFCSDVHSLEYEYITKGQTIAQEARDYLAAFEKSMNNKKYRDAIQGLTPNFRADGELASKYKTIYDKRSEYAIRFHFCLAYFLGSRSDARGLSYNILDKIIADPASDPWVKQIRVLSQLLKGINMARRFSMLKDVNTSELKQAVELLRPFVVTNPRIRVGNDTALKGHYLNLLGASDESALGKFQSIVGKSEDYVEICKKVDAYARYYLGVALFILSGKEQSNLVEITNILTPIENESSPFFNERRLNWIKATSALCLARNASIEEGNRSESSSAFDQAEVETMLNFSDDELRTAVTLDNGFGSAAQAPKTSVSSGSQRPTPPSRPAPPIPSRVSTAGASSSSGSIPMPPSRPAPPIPSRASTAGASSSSGSIPMPPPVSVSSSSDVASSSSAQGHSAENPAPERPAMAGNLLLEIQRGFQLRKVANPDSKEAKAERKAKAQAATPQDAMAALMWERAQAMKTARGGLDSNSSAATGYSR